MALVPTPQPPLASYDHVDIEDGFGHTTLYCFIVNAATHTYAMSKTAFYSGAVVHRLTNPANGTVTLTIDSPTFNQTRIMKGTAFLSWTGGIYPGGSGTYTLGYTVKLYHYDGSTETQLGSTFTTETFDRASGAGAKVNAFCASISIATAQKFKPGDLIRIKLGVVTSGSTDSTYYMETGFDPKNRDSEFAIKPSTDAEASTVMLFTAPFKIN